MRRGKSKYICNPINVEYKYQVFEQAGKLTAYREAADPSMVLFKGKYYLFPSMMAGFLVSDNLIDWNFHSLAGVPVYGYAPDVRVIGEYLYFSASGIRNCSFFRTKDPIHGEFEEMEGTFPFWDPNLFVDDDGSVYFYWGCSNDKPLYGVELNPESMNPKGEQVALIFGNPSEIGYERNGENHNSNDAPFIEGAWMDKHNGKYYLQYSSPGSEYNVYSDGVYVSDHPLGPFTLAENNPYSYKPGGFIPGAGHGSTMKDRHGDVWHASTMRISVNHIFERRLGLWPAGFDQDGELFCNQRFGDWPMKIEQTEMNQRNPWENPPWMLLSYRKPSHASSFEPGKEPSKATDENVQTWWRAASNTSGEWLEVDLKHACAVHSIQINFADDHPEVSLPDGAALHPLLKRYIDERKHVTRWLLEGSLDGKSYFVIEDKSNEDTDLPHDLVVIENGLRARYIRCTVKELPFNQHACISGLRVFGIGEGELPKQARGVRTKQMSELDLSVTWDVGDAVGYNVLWGFASDKLYHSYMVLGSNEVNIGALVKGQPLFLRVDAFNEIGITEGEVFEANLYPPES